MEGEAQVLEEKVVPQLELLLSLLIGTTISPVSELSEALDPDESYELRTIDVWQYIPYIPETDRFGGETGLSIAESHFFASSKACLGSLGPIHVDTDYDQVIGIAIRLHLAMLYYSGWKVEQLAYFFNLVALQWLPRAFPTSYSKLTEAQFQEKQEDTLAYFENAFQQQKNNLVRYVIEFMEDFREDFPFEDPTFETWRLHCRELWEMMQKAHEMNLLKPRSEKYHQPLFENLPQEQAPFAAQFADFIHLTNNRLGIPNRDEGFLAYLISRSLQEV